MGARVYDPYTGTFTQPDPIFHGSANAYGYTDGDPVSEVDLAGTNEEATDEFGRVTPLWVEPEEFGPGEPNAHFGSEGGQFDDVGEYGADGDVVRHYTTEENAAGIDRDGTINASRDGNVYLTRDVYTNGADAQSGLNMAREPDGYLEVPTDSLTDATGPFDVDGGTGTQILNRGEVDAKGLKFRRFP